MRGRDAGMTAGRSDRQPGVDISLLSDPGDGHDRAPNFGEPDYEQNKFELSITNF